MRLKIRKLAHSNVPIATMIITPVKAAIGNFPIMGAPIKMMSKMVNAATIPESLALEPAERLTNVCAIIGQPPNTEEKTIQNIGTSLSQTFPVAVCPWCS